MKVFMEFGKKVDRRRYLEEKFDDLLEVIGSTYGNILKSELLSRLIISKFFKNFLFLYFHKKYKIFRSKFKIYCQTSS